MLNPFPDLLAFGLLAPFLFRMVSGLCYLFLGFSSFRDPLLNQTRLLRLMSPGYRYAVGTLFILGSLFLILGLFTQITALALSIIVMGIILRGFKNKAPQKPDFESLFFIALEAITLSLVITGAGFFAIDLPL